MPSVPASDKSRPWPECSHMLRAKANLCAHCGAIFDAFGYVISRQSGAQPAPVEGAETDPDVKHLYRNDNLLVVRNGAKFPKRCLKTNAPTKRLLQQTFYWHHPARYLALLLGIGVYIIAALVTRSKSTLNLPLCEERHDKRTRDILITATLLGAGFLTFIIALAGNYIGLLAAPAILVFGAAIYWSFLGRPFTARRIENNHTHLAGVCPEFLATLPEWRGH